MFLGKTYHSTVSTDGLKYVQQECNSPSLLIRLTIFAHKLQARSLGSLMPSHNIIHGLCRVCGLLNQIIDEITRQVTGGVHSWHD